MKWNDLPTWVKVLIIVFSVLLVVYLIALAVDYFKNHKHEIYQKLRAVRREIRQLVSEKRRIIRALFRAKLYTQFTVGLLKIALLVAFILFTEWLVLQYKLDGFSALAVSTGTVVTIYSIGSCLFNFKIRGLNELKELTAIRLEHLYRKKLNADPAQIMVIDSKIKGLTQQADLLRENLRNT